MGAAEYGTKPILTASDIDWRAHPFSGVRTPALHFSQVSYAADKLGELGDTALKYGKTGTDTATEAARSAGKRIARAIHGRFN